GWFDQSLVENEPDCLSTGEVNLQALFPRVAVIVHHGGAGTTTAAALAGGPQVVVSHHYDQHYWARRVQALGIGVAHASHAPTAEPSRPPTIPCAFLSAGECADARAGSRTPADDQQLLFPRSLPWVRRLDPPRPDGW